MSDTEIMFGIQFGLSLVIYGLLTGWFIAPWLRGLSARHAAIIVLIPQLFHYVGSTTLVTSVVAPDLPPAFGVPVTVGDGIIILLSLAAIVCLRKGSAVAVPILWAFTAVGFVYHPYIGWLGKELAVAELLGPHWYVAVFYVPVLMVGHWLILMMLLRRRRELQE